MTPEQVLANIREANFSYLALAQKLVIKDRPSALVSLGITDESATMLELMTTAQMMKVASGNTLLCNTRIDDDMVWGLLTSHGRGVAQNDESNRAHDCSHDSTNQVLAERLLGRTLMVA